MNRHGPRVESAPHAEPSTVSVEADYARVLAIAERDDWRIDDVLPDDARFDFSRPFLPESLVASEALSFLAPRERLLVNQIRAAGYLGLFGIVEEMILPFVVSHARLSGFETLPPVRALLRFASEEAKHIELFRRFRARFERGFGSPCELIGPADAFVRAALDHHPLAVALAILHIEWMTQRHWIEAVRGATELEPSFTRLLKHHWMEEAQHAKLDDLLARRLAAPLDEAARATSFAGYAQIIALLDGALAAQAELDLAAFERAAGRRLSAGERAQFVEGQHASMRHTFLLSGITHPELVATVADIVPRGRERLGELVAAYA